MNTLKSAIEWFLTHCSDHRKLSPHTLKAYRHDLEHLSGFLTNSGLDSSIKVIDRNSIRRWLGSMVDVKPRTVRRRLATIKSMFASLERHDNSNENPLSGFRSEVRVGISLPRTVARSTVRSLLRASRKESVFTEPANGRKTPDAAIIEFLFATASE
jgi:integrase/recombinase XerD